MNSIFETIGKQVKYNYYGVTYTGTVNSVREITTSNGVYNVIIGEHCVTCDKHGRGAKYNGFSTAFVKCEDTPETWETIRTISAFYDTDMISAIKATVASRAAA